MRKIALYLAVVLFAPALFAQQQAPAQPAAIKATLTAVAALGPERGARLLADSKAIKELVKKHDGVMADANAKLKRLNDETAAKLAGTDVLIKGYRAQIQEDIASIPANYQFNLDSDLFEFIPQQPAPTAPAEAAKAPTPDKKEQ